MFKSEFNDEVPDRPSEDGLLSAGQELDLTIARGGADVPPAPAADVVPIIASPDRRGSRDLTAAEPAGSLAVGPLLAAEGSSKKEAAAASGDPHTEADEAPAAGSGGIDTPVDPPHENTAPPPDEIPDPAEVARRIAAATGRTKLNPDAPLDPEMPLQQVDFEIASRVGAETAVVRVGRRSEETTIDNQGDERPAREDQAEATVGYYDPLTGWKFYPEFIPPAAQAALAESMEAAAEIAEIHLAVEADEQGYAMLEIRHPITVAARQEIAQRLAETSVVQELPDRLSQVKPAFGERFWYDEATSATCTIHEIKDSRFQDDGESVAQQLHVSYRGLRGGSAEDGTAKRVDLSIKVASRPRGETIWRPNEDLITPDDWDTFVGISDILERYAAADPHFSMRDCAVYRNGYY